MQSDLLFLLLTHLPAGRVKKEKMLLVQEAITMQPPRRQQCPPIDAVHAVAVLPNLAGSDLS